MKYATVEKTAAGFEAVKEKIEDIESGLAEFGDVTKQLRRQNRRLLQVAGSAPVQKDDAGIWLHEEQAKQFGELVMVAAGKKKPETVTKDLGEIIGSAGGVLVPDELSQRIIDLMTRYGKFRANTTILPVNSARVHVPKIGSDMIVYCPDEGGSITASDISLEMITMMPKKWAALTAISNELEEDAASSVGILVASSIARQMAKYEDLCGFLGDGTSTYFAHKGIVGAFHSISDTISEIAGLKVASGNAYSEITLDDLRDVVALLPADYEEGAKWYCSKKFYYDVMHKLAEAAGVANIFEILSDKKTRNFLGYPVEFVSVMPVAEANSQICCILGDLSMGSMMAQRKILSLDRSSDVYFATDQIGIRGIQRVDFNVFGCGDTTNPGPIVGLITAAS